MASIWFESSRPALAGAFGGLVAALKYYPAAMVIGPRPAHRIRYALALGVVVAGRHRAVASSRLASGGAVFYYQHVLLPSLGSHNPDCAYDSVRTLFARIDRRRAVPACRAATASPGRRRPCTSRRSPSSFLM